MIKYLSQRNWLSGSSDTTIITDENLGSQKQGFEVPHEVMPYNIRLSISPRLSSVRMRALLEGRQGLQPLGLALNSQYIFWYMLPLGTSKWFVVIIFSHSDGQWTWVKNTAKSIQPLSPGYWHTSLIEWCPSPEELRCWYHNVRHIIERCRRSASLAKSICHGIRSLGAFSDAASLSAPDACLMQRCGSLCNADANLDSYWKPDRKRKAII